jgi:IS30 family transposase
VGRKSELWQRWRRGESQREIARGLHRVSSCVYNVVAAEGGVAPRPRRRCARALTSQEREEISRGLAKGQARRVIRRRLGRSPSTVSREVARNGGRGLYRAAPADRRAWRLGQRPKRCWSARHRALRRAVAALLARRWSPQQISGWLRQAFPSDPTMQVSHETISRSLFVQSRGVLKRALVQHHGRPRGLRRARAATSRPRSRILDAVSIRDRPAEVADRAVPGHWEGDLVTGAHCSHIVTLVEQQSRFENGALRIS